MNVSLSATDRAIHEIRLVAGEPLLVVLSRSAASSYSSLELLSHDGLAPIYFRWGAPAKVKGRDCDVFPAVIGTLQIPVPGYGASGNTLMNLQLISAGAPLISLTRR